MKAIKVIYKLKIGFFLERFPNRIRNVEHFLEPQEPLRNPFHKVVGKNSA